MMGSFNSEAREFTLTSVASAMGHGFALRSKGVYYTQIPS